MDPKDNTEPNGAKDAQTNTPDMASTDATQSANMNNAPSLSPDESANTSAATGQDQGAGQGIEVDLSALSDTPTGGTTDATNPVAPDATATPDATSDTTSTPVAFGDPTVDPTASPSPSPDAPVVPPTDPSAASNAVPPTVPDFGSSTPGTLPDQQIGADSTPPAGANTGMPGPTVSAPMPDQSTGAGVPPTAPVPVHRGDKKTIMVLGGVAVILIAAIVVLFLL